jgi:hypothetical protein
LSIAKDVEAGVAQVNITPPVGVPLAGGLRARESEGVDDPLYARALVLSDGVSYAVIAALDLIVICRQHVEEASKLIHAQTGIPRDSILVCASHTHSGPYTAELLDPKAKPDPAYMKGVNEKIAEVVTEAYERLEPVKIGFASAMVKDLMHNRRLVDEKGSVWNSWLVPPERHGKLQPAGPIDEQIQVLSVKGLDESNRAIIFNYPLHANIHFGKNISADYPGIVAKLISEKLGSGVVSLFMPGACGDINVRLGVGLNQVGDAIASSILSAMDQIDYTRKCKLGAVLKEIALPLRDFSHFQEEEISLKWPDGLDIFRNEYEILSKLEEREVKTVIHVLRINDAAFIGVPGEIFVELGLDIKARSPFKYNFVTELSNDYIGYIPTIKAFKQGGYETFNARSSKVAAGSGEKIVEESLNIMRKF